MQKFKVLPSSRRYQTNNFDFKDQLSFKEKIKQIIYGVKKALRKSKRYIITDQEIYFCSNLPNFRSNRKFSREAL